ncbi:DUF6527 family protein [Agromyces sp. NBRC 114283]|uniref:DUF6527 family protein n=1 Tax=Agromyces sp. NBRC 114283 TaxID=2994521 RepID=UPI0024A49536|nr:DUF6527 family protein [Agromyces sp. NBRC 114283]GLU91347.1 hypothetical protein Agsp01_36020 [Agromyces sp. NBRC 114283]
MKAHETGGQPSHCFWCPGCDMAHCINDTMWSFNGDLERPTFQPSVLVQGGAADVHCHSFVTDGRIQFLTDSRHALAGKTVDLPDWPLT